MTIDASAEPPSRCPLCGGPPHSDWRTDELGSHHRDTTSGLVGAEPGLPEVNAYLRRISSRRYAAEDAEALS